MSKQHKQFDQRIKTYLSKKDLVRLDQICARLNQSRYKFLKTAVLQAISFMEHWFAGHLSQLGTTFPYSMPTSLPSLLRSNGPNPPTHDSQETEVERQVRLDKRRKQALTLSNPAVAQTLETFNYNELKIELLRAFRRRSASRPKEKYPNDKQK